MALRDGVDLNAAPGDEGLAYPRAMSTQQAPSIFEMEDVSRSYGDTISGRRPLACSPGT